MAPKKTRKYKTKKKTTTKQGKREYQKFYMRDWRTERKKRDTLVIHRLKEIDKDFYNRLFPPKKRRKKKW